MAVVHADSNTFDDEVLNSELPVVVDFWAEWCGPCRALGPVLNKMSEKFENVKVVKVDIQSNPDLASRYGVTSIPYLVGIKDGDVVNRAVGFRGVESVKEFFESVL
jgi:thioredoxin